MLIIFFKIDIHVYWRSKCTEIVHELVKTYMYLCMILYLMVILFIESPMSFHNDSWLTSRNCSIRFSSKSSNMNLVTWVPVNFLSVGMDSRRAGLQEEIQVMKSDGAGIFLADWKSIILYLGKIFMQFIFSRFFLSTLNTVNSLFLKWT